jgi:hypothetical protein
MTSDIIAILAQSFVEDERSFKFEADVLAAFNEESEMLQSIVEARDAGAYSDQLKNLLDLTQITPLGTKQQTAVSLRMQDQIS